MSVFSVQETSLTTNRNKTDDCVCTTVISGSELAIHPQYSFSCKPPHTARSLPRTDRELLRNRLALDALQKTMIRKPLRQQKS